MTPVERAFLVHITTRDADEARRLARLLVEGRLAACANLVPAVESLYRWRGELVEDRESLLLVKTSERLLEPLMRAVREAHSYEVPAILAIPLERVDPPYLDWLLGELRD